MSGSRAVSVVRPAVIAIGCCLLVACVAGPVPFRTVAGSEHPELLAGLSGRFAIDEGLSSICHPLRTVDPSRQRRCIPHLNDSPGAWTAAIVPDQDERFVLRMRMAYRAGPAPEAVRQPVDVTLERLTYCKRGTSPCESGDGTIATWERPPGSNLYHQTLSVSPDGRYAAIVPESHILRGPGFTPRSRSGVRFAGQRLVGELKIVDLHTGSIRATGLEVADTQPVSWSRDGRGLLLVRDEPVEQLSPALAARVVGDEGQVGQGIPVIETFDLESGARTMLAIGQQPLWSPDDRTLLYQPADDRVETLDLVDQQRRPAVLPGMSTRYEPIAIALVAPRRVLYWSLPTDGANPAFTTDNSPLVGPKQKVSLKVADLDTGGFATVCPGVDPRARVGYRAD